MITKETKPGPSGAGGRTRVGPPASGEQEGCQKQDHASGQRGTRHEARCIMSRSKEAEGHTPDDEPRTSAQLPPTYIRNPTISMAMLSAGWGAFALHMLCLFPLLGRKSKQDNSRGDARPR